VAVMLTTVDNPYDPFDDFDEWFKWDAHAGYHTCGLLARLTHTSSDLSEPDQLLAVEMAIDSVIELNVDGVYRKVVRED
jgi:hypothetical protein